MALVSCVGLEHTVVVLLTWLGQIATNVPPVVSAHDVVVSFARDVVGDLLRCQLM